MPVTLRDIAKSLGLSHATVSFVLNERHDVAIPEATRQRVINAAREMGYRPNSLARALVSGRTQTVAICLPVLRHPFYYSVFHSLFEVCQQNGYSALIYQTSRSPARRAVDWPVDGVIAVDSVGMLRRGELPEHLPVVSIGEWVDTTTDHVQIDLSEGSSLAMAHLIDIGCERITHVRVENFTDPNDDRVYPYDHIIEESGIHCETISVAKPQAELVRRAVREHVEAGGNPDAFLCSNEMGTLATLRGLADLGRSVPRDFKLIGFDAIDEGAMVVPSVTAVAKPVPIMCRQAVEFLLARVRDPKQPVLSAIFPTTLVVRDSTANEGEGLRDKPKGKKSPKAEKR